ncbi:hypothetical protein CL689_04050 [Candidatus Saccharibacteria bacterium]|nr:hypothetical protein [Candidatus Saccharibacteria bacterium]|tara:strand:- start:1713 stop:2375 length:663 start_codon:yes stop_codon:yes gene_type:complete
MSFVQQASSGSAAAAQGALGNDAKDIEDRFLKLLVAQLKNQDPLEPMDNAQVTSQMAQLNTVTGVQNLNKSMQELLGSFESSELLRATSLIGGTVVVDGNRVGVVEGQSTFAGFQVESPVNNARFEVVDALGKTVYEQELGGRSRGNHEVSWDGRDSSGDQVAPGVYQFRVTTENGGARTPLRTFETRQVFGVNTEGDGITLNIGGGESVDISEVVEFGA